MPDDLFSARDLDGVANIRNPTKRNIRRVTLKHEIRGSGGGKGGGSPRVAQEDPDTLQAKQTAKVIDLLSEGEIEGLVDGWSSIFLDGTALETQTGGRNFNGVVPDFRYGLPDQEHYPGFPAAENTINVSAEVLHGTPVVRAINDPAIDAVRVQVQIPALYKQDKTNGDMHGFEVHITIDMRSAGGMWTQKIDHLIKGKTKSSYPIDYRIELEGNAPWEIRVNRISPADVDSSTQSKTFWSTYTQITDGKFTYPSCASAALMVDAQQFGSSIPVRTYEIRGIKIKYPSNMNPLARTFSGLWNGTFNYGYCNDPVWVLYDILTRRNRGVPPLVPEERVDKWSFYVASQYASQLVPDGYGNQEFRFSFNGSISQPEEAFHVLQAVASSFRGIVYWSSGMVFVRCDMPQPPVKLVTPANVIDQDGVLFNYSGSAARARHTVAMVTYSDPLNGYESAIEMVESPEAIARYGWNPLPITAVGCTSRGQAHRFGRWALDTEQNETETVTYQASMDHADLSPGDIISVQDPDYANVRMGGRIANFDATNKIVELDAPVTLLTGQTYTLSLTKPDGTLQDTAITTGPGTHTQVTVADTPITSQNAVWIITGSDVAPRRFRVMAIREVESNIYEISALFHDPTKYARVEFGVKLDPPPYMRPDNQTDPVTNITFTEESVMVSDTVVRNLRVGWTPPNSPLVSRYRLRWRRNLGEWSDPITVYVPEYTIPNVLTGTYEVLITAASAFGHESIATAASYEVALGGSSLFPPVANIRIKGGGLTFTGRDAVIEWDASPVTSNGAVLRDYHVTILDAVTNNIVRVDIATVPGYTYWYDFNVSDGGPRRTFKIEVRVRDTFDRLSAPGTATVSNPVPALPTGVALTGGFRFYTMKFIRPAELDYAGILIWASTTTGFVPGDSNLVADSADSPILIQGVSGQTYYVRYAAYDDFGKTGLLISGEVVVQTVNINHAEMVGQLIDETNLFPSLITRIDKIDAAGTGLVDKVAQLTSDLGDTDAKIVTETNTRIEADTALGTRIDAVVAQATGFNAALNYQFNTDLESWAATGGTLTWQAGGVIRHVHTVADSYIQSASDLTLNGSLNRYVRAKITRVAGSGWDGRVYYTTSGHGMVATHYKQVNNPNLAIGASATLSFDMHALTAGGDDWKNSTITRLRLDLGATTADQFDIDWIAVGSEGPAAGTAAVLAAMDAAASATSAQASRIDTLYARVAALQYRELFDGDLTAFNTRWTSASGAGELSINATGQTGLNALRVGNNAGSDIAWIYGDENTAFDPTRLYKITFRVKRTAGTGTFHGGFAAYAADGTTLLGSTGGSGVTGTQHWVAALSAAPGTDWTTYTGYLKGYSATGVAGTANVRNDPTQPGTLWSTAKFIRPVMVLNANSVAGTMEVDSVTIEFADTEAALQVEAKVLADDIGNLEGQYTVKVDLAGHVSGFGLASTLKEATPHSAFIVNADKFALAKPGSNPLEPTVPFIVDTASTPPKLSFAGYASIDRLTTGYLEGEYMVVGPNNPNAVNTPYVVVDGIQSNIRVSNGTRDVVKMGGRTDGSYGFDLLDNSGNVIFSNTAGLGTGVVKFANMAFGAGVNQLYNGDFQLNHDGWLVSDNSTGLPVSIGLNVDANNTIPGLGLFWWSVPGPGTPANGTAFTVMSNGQNNVRYPVVAGRRYEASAYMGQWRAGSVNIALHFFNAAGTQIGSAFHGNAVTKTGPFNRIDQLVRSSVFATAPTGAVTCSVRMWTHCNGQNWPYGVGTQVYFGEALPNQSEPSVWVPGPNPIRVDGIGGLGDLAKVDKVEWNTHITNIPGFQKYAFLDTITAANIGTYISTAAIGDAWIANLAATKLRAGFIDVHDIVVRFGSVRVIDSNNANRNRVWLGHRPTVDYGMWITGPDGVDIISATDVNGVKIRNASIDTLKLGGETVIVPRSATSPTLRYGNGTFQKALEFTVYMPYPGRLAFWVSAAQAFPSGPHVWTLRGQIYLSNGQSPFIDRGGAAMNDSPSLSGDCIVPAGTHTCVVWWHGANSNVRLTNCNMIVMGAMR